MNGTRICSVVGCGRKHEARGWCHSHFEAQRRGAHPNDFKPFLDSDKKRFMAKFTVLPSGHWIWNGATSSEGRYGSATFNKRVRPAHVVSWLLFRGPITDGLVVDHLCRKTLCVNPDHLEPKTQRENILIGEAPSALNAAKTHCKRGHEFTIENTRIMLSGGRACRSCEKLRWNPATGRRRRAAEY